MQGDKSRATYKNVPLKGSRIRSLFRNTGYFNTKNRKDQR